jgi:hypothetical protein
MTKKEYCKSVSLQDFIKDMSPIDRLLLLKEKNAVEYKNQILRRIYDMELNNTTK